MKNFRQFTMEIKEDRSEFAETTHTRLMLDTTQIRGVWEDQDGGCCLDLDMDNYKVTETLEEVMGILGTA